MRNYEMVYIVSPDVDEEQLEGVKAKIEQMITGSGGEVLEQDSWGMRRLAYPIQKFREGRYMLAKVKLESKGVMELRRGLGLSEEVIRYLLVRTDEEAEQPEEGPAAAVEETAGVAYSAEPEPAKEEELEGNLG